jgi:hypothetical protein
VGVVCECPGGTVEATCGDAQDDDCDGQVDCADADCALDPLCVSGGISAVDYPVLAHGGALVITGSGFTGATGVTIGGVAQSFSVLSDTQIELVDVPDATPIGATTLEVAGASGDFTFPITVIHLVVNELDSDQVGSDTAELVEIATGVPGVSLAGYTLVLWNGNGDVSYLTVPLNATTDANGFVLVANVGMTAELPVIPVNAANSLQNGPDAVGVHQAPAASLPNGTTLAQAAAAGAIIDALVYETADADDLELIAGLLLAGGSVDEGTTGVNSIQRCGAARRDGGAFTSITTPTPSAVNTCP